MSKSSEKIFIKPKLGDIVICNTQGRHTGIIVEIKTGYADSVVYIVMIDERSLVPFLSKEFEVIETGHIK